MEYAVERRRKGFAKRYASLNLLLDIDKTLTGGSGVGDIRSGEERAAFDVDYVLDPNIPAKPPVADDGEDPIRDANGNYIFTKGENGKYQLVLTDSEGNEHTLETDEIPATIQDARGNIYQVGESGEINAMNIQHDMDEVIIQGLSDNYEVVINDETEKTTTDKKLKLVYENQILNMQLRKSNGDSIKTGNIQWQITENKKTNVSDSILTKEITVKDKDITIVIYEKIPTEKGKEKKAKIAEFTFVPRQSPYVTLSALSNYDGEFGFDDGEDFNDNSTPKLQMQYDTVHVADKDNKTKILYVPWLTLVQGQTANLQVKMSEEIEGDSIYCEAPRELNVIYNENQKRLTVINTALNNSFKTPAYISIYRNDKYGLQKKMLIGKCAVISRQPFNPIKVQIVYFASDTIKPQNNIDATRLQTLLNSNSMNQSFTGFTVLPDAIKIKDTLNSITKADFINAYKAILRICARKGMVFTENKHPTTVYIVMTELQFTKSENNGITIERGGGVMNNSNLAIMWTISRSNEDKEKLIIHEIGHTLGLSDVFNDKTLGNPSQSFSRYNYMDYNVTRKMFFRTQIETIIDNLNTTIP
jgi:hypothetical protein